MDILVRSWQDLGTILAKILSRSCHGIHFAMVRSYQESQDASKSQPGYRSAKITTIPIDLKTCEKTRKYRVFFIPRNVSRVIFPRISTTRSKKRLHFWNIFKI